MLMPKKTKYRKAQKGRRRTEGQASRGNILNFGDFGLKALESRWITARQIEATRQAVTRFLKKGGKMWIRIFPTKPVTAKAAEVGMGKGKGSVDHYVAPIKAGAILFEITGVSEDIAKQALRLASHKLPIKTKFIEKS